jgi:hypothetical protein
VRGGEENTHEDGPAADATNPAPSLGRGQPERHQASDYAQQSGARGDRAVLRDECLRPLGLCGIRIDRLDSGESRRQLHEGGLGDNGEKGEDQSGHGEGFGPKHQPQHAAGGALKLLPFMIDVFVVLRRRRNRSAVLRGRPVGLEWGSHGRR